MVLDIEYVRKTYPKEYGDMSDEEVQETLDFFYTFGHIMIDWHLKHPGENFIKGKTKETESTFNKEWHKVNSMPMKGTLDEKIKRHIEHVAHCKCRPMPENIKQEIQKRLG